MFRPDQYHREAQASEGNVLRIFLLGSVLFHVGIFFVDPSGLFKSKPREPEEWVIETDLSFSDLPVPEKKPQKKAEPRAEMDQAAAKKMLPQLPKRFKVKDEDDEGFAEAVPDKKKDVVKKIEKEKPLPEPAPKIAHKDDEATEQFKDEIFKRLEREVQRQASKEKKEKQKKQRDAKIADRLLSRRIRELSDKAKVNADHPYVRELQRTINNQYSPPSIYKHSGAGQPVLLLQIGKRGDIESLEMLKSSNNEALDRFAEKSLNEMSPFPVPPRELWGQPFQVHLGGDTRM